MPSGRGALARGNPNERCYVLSHDTDTERENHLVQTGY